MEDVVKSYCMIDNKNDTNTCINPLINEVYNNRNNQVYRVNYFISPSSLYLNPGPNNVQNTHIGSRFNPLTSNMTVIIDSNYEYLPPKIKYGNHPNNNSNNVNTLFDTNLLFANNTQSYAHIGHVSKDNTTLAHPFF
jgi:hypothetical protein